MNALDDAVLQFLNGFARRSWSFDHLVEFISTSNLFKGGVMMAMLWGLWFRETEDRDRARGHVVVTILAAIVAIAVARLLALKLPFRVRPMHNEELGFTVPYGMPEWMLDSWSAFPSDHAVLFVALTTGIAFISRTAGALAAAWVTLFILLPRMYLGLHYPTDILAGALLGVTIATMANLPWSRRVAGEPALRWANASPLTFFACFFVLSFEVAVLFEDGRDLASLMYHLIAARF